MAEDVDKDRRETNRRPPYLLVDGPLHCYLKKLRIKSVRLTPTRMDGYVRVDRAEGHGFVDLSFLIHD